jgi:hypothetical protein
MININREKWEISKADTPAKKILIEKWLEIFNRYTIDTYRVHFHSSHSILVELLDLLAISREFNIPPRYLQWVAEEALALLKDDPVIPQIIKPYGALLGELSNKLNWENEGAASNIKYLVGSFVGLLNTSYLESLFQAVKIKVKQGDEDSIVKLVDRMGSYLVSSELSPDFLYAVGNSFFKDQSLSFEDKLDNFLESITPKENTFQVVIKFELSNADSAPENILDIEISKKKNPKTKNPIEISYLTGGDYTYYATVNMKARDLHMAGIKSVQKLESALDVYSYGFPINKIAIDSYVIVYMDLGRQFKRVAARPILPGFYRSDEEWFRTVNQYTSQIYQNQKVSNRTKDKIRSALRYGRQGRLSINVEEKFMNIWIAFEFLLRRPGYRNIIDPIIEFGPKILSIYHCRKILRDLVENINRLKVVYSQNIREKLDTGRQFKSKEARLLAILRNQVDRQELLEASQNWPLLQFRIKQVADRFSSSESIWKSIQTHEQIVRWHLARIYRLRNRIVHGGEHNLLINQLSSNLTSYLFDTLNEAVYQLATRESWNSIEDVISAYAFTYDIAANRLKKDKTSSIHLDEVIDPIRCLIP